MSLSGLRLLLAAICAAATLQSVSAAASPPGSSHQCPHSSAPTLFSSAVCSLDSAPSLASDRRGINPDCGGDEDGADHADHDAAATVQSISAASTLGSSHQCPRPSAPTLFSSAVCSPDSAPSLASARRGINRDGGGDEDGADHAHHDAFPDHDHDACPAADADGGFDGAGEAERLLAPESDLYVRRLEDPEGGLAVCTRVAGEIEDVKCIYILELEGNESYKNGSLVAGIGQEERQEHTCDEAWLALFDQCYGYFRYGFEKSSSSCCASFLVAYKLELESHCLNAILLKKCESLWSCFNIIRRLKHMLKGCTERRWPIIWFVEISYGVLGSWWSPKQIRVAVAILTVLLHYVLSRFYTLEEFMDMLKNKFLEVATYVWQSVKSWLSKMVINCVIYVLLIMAFLLVLATTGVDLRDW